MKTSPRRVFNVNDSLKPPWDELRGQEVQIHHKGVLVRTGYVEDITHTGDGLSLQQSGIDLRTLYTHAGGYSVSPLPVTPHDGPGWTDR